jgi:hypothetical protein
MFSDAFARAVTLSNQVKALLATLLTSAAFCNLPISQAALADLIAEFAFHNHLKPLTHIQVPQVAIVNAISGAKLPTHSGTYSSPFK